jgi:hypothetical protein
MRGYGKGAHGEVNNIEAVPKWAMRAQSRRIDGLLALAKLCRVTLLNVFDDLTEAV